MILALCASIALFCARAEGASGGHGSGARSGGLSGSHGPGGGGTHPAPSSGDAGGSSTSAGISASGPRGSYVPAGYYGGNYYPGGYYGGYNRYYYRGQAPKGATFGFFFAGTVVRRAPAWWPYYAVAVPPVYYDPYYQFPYSPPPYVIEIPPEESTTAYPQGPEIIEVPPAGAAATYPIGPRPAPAAPPAQCFAPKTDARGNMLKENGNMIPDFSKPVPCPPQQAG